MIYPEVDLRFSQEVGLKRYQTSHVRSLEVDPRFFLEMGLEIGQSFHLRSPEAVLRFSLEVGSKIDQTAYVRSLEADLRFSTELQKGKGRVNGTMTFGHGSDRTEKVFDKTITKENFVSW